MQTTDGVEKKEIRLNLWNIIVYFDCDDFESLKEALYSVVAQPYKEKKITIVFKISSESSSLDIKNLIKYIEPLVEIELVMIDQYKNRGQAMNIVLDRNIAEFVSFLDYDDVYYPEFSTEIIERLKQNHNVVCGNSVKALQKKFYKRSSYYKTVGVIENNDKNINDDGNKLMSFLNTSVSIQNIIIMSSFFAYSFKDYPNIRFDKGLSTLSDWDFLSKIYKDKDLRSICVDKTVGEERIKERLFTVGDINSRKNLSKEFECFKEEYEKVVIPVGIFNFARNYKELRISNNQKISTNKGGVFIKKRSLVFPIFYKKVVKILKYIKRYL